MKGLLLNDFYLAKKHCRMYLLMLIFPLGSLYGESSQFFLFYPCVFIGLLPMTMIAYDESFGWHRYMLTLPCTRAQYVGGKYLFGLLCSMTVLVWCSLLLLLSIVKSGLLWENFLAGLGLMGLFTFGGSSVLLPFVFRFGPEKGRLVYYGVMVVFLVFCSMLGVLPKSMPVFAQSWLVLLLPLGAMIYGLSWRLSVRLYPKREL